MALVRFEPADFEVEVAPGTRLIDVTDEHPAADVPYSCRSATCGTCRVEVRAGADGLAPPSDEEAEMLELLDERPGVRLCCQLVLAREVPRLVLRVVGAE
jgi:2Fe-2S ferredoxin